MTKDVNPGAIRASLAELARMAVPMIISRAGLATMAIADAVMVSRFSPSEFAALSLADGTLGRIVDVFAAFIIGGLILVPRAFGAGDTREASRIWRRSILPAVGLGLLGLVIGLLGRNIFHLLGQSAQLASQAGSLSSILGLGYVAALLAIGAAVFLEGARRPATVAVSVVLANLVNIGLNWLLIAGHASFPAMGARGSAISTTVVRLLLAVVLVTCALKRPRGNTSVAKESIEPVSQHTLGLSAAAIQAILLALTSSLLIFAGWLGPIQIAALSAVWNLNAPAMLIALGLADATGIRVASADGKKNRNASRFIVKVGIIAMAAVALLFIVLWSSLPRTLAAVFTSDSRMLQDLVPLIPLAGFLIVFDSLSFIVLSALRAMRDIAWPTAIEIGTMAALVPLAFCLAFWFSLGVKGLLLAAIVSAVGRTALLFWRFSSITSSAVIHSN